VDKRLIVEIMLLLVGGVIVEDLVVDHRRAMVVVDDGVVGDVGDSDVAVVVHAVEIVMVHDDGTIPPAISSDIDIDSRKAYAADHADARSPPSVGVVWFKRREGEPSDVHARAYPCDPARIPAGAGIPDRSNHDSTNHAHRWCPIPASARIGADPVAVMVRRVAEVFLGNPGLVFVPFSPSAFGERFPVFLDLGRTPHGSLLAFVLDGVPSTVFIQVISVVLEFRRHVADGVSLHVHALRPQVIAGRVPVIPIGIHRAGAVFDVLSIAQNGR